MDYTVDCTGEESRTIKCQNGGKCYVVEVDAADRLLKCKCPEKYVGDRCLEKYTDPVWSASVEGLMFGGVAVAVLVLIAVVLCAFVYVRHRRKKTREKERNRTSDTRMEKTMVEVETEVDDIREVRIPLQATTPQSIVDGTSPNNDGCKSNIQHQQSVYDNTINTFDNAVNHSESIARTNSNGQGISTSEPTERHSLLLYAGSRPRS